MNENLVTLTLIIFQINNLFSQLKFSSYHNFQSNYLI